MKIVIDRRGIGPHEPCFIIAEAGSNHDGSFDQARRLVDVAAEAEVDAVKFQLFRADRIAARSDRHMVTEKKFTEQPKTLHDFFRDLELRTEWLEPLKQHAESQGLVFLVTPFDEESAQILDEIAISAFKIASFELVHIPLLQTVARFGKPIILSTGMSDLGEIGEAVAAIGEEGNTQIALMHCGIDYPLDPADVHLRSMVTMSEQFSFPVGYSDHTLGSTVPVAAVALGARLYEKHFTLDRGLPGPDHKFALVPDELREMVRAIRECEAALGSPEKTVRETELVYLRRGRRSLFAAVDIEAGRRITREMVAVLRPGTGLKPKYLPEVLGREARHRIAAHEPLTWDALR